MEKEKRKYERRPVKNLEVRAMIVGEGIRYGDVAKKIHVSDSTLSQWLCNDLRDWQRAEILGAIAEIKLERGLT